MHRPLPRLTLRIVEWLAPTWWRQSIQGDLEEEWRRSPRGSRLRALGAALDASLRLSLFRFRPGPGPSPDRGRGDGALAATARELLFALRLLLKHPTSTAAAVLTLALGIGSNVVIFSVVDAVLLKPLPFPEEDRVVLIEQIRSSGQRSGLPGYLTETFRAGSASIESLSTFSTGESEVWGPEGPELIPVVSAQTSLLEVLDAPLAAGAVSDGESDAFLVATAAFVERRLGGGPPPLGELLRVGMGVGSESMPLRAVLPAGIHFPDLDVELLSLTPPPPGGVPLPVPGRAQATLTRRVVARLVPGVSAEQARTELQGLADALYAEAGIDGRARIAMTGLRESMVGDVRPALIALVVSLSLLLLISCANVAHLLAARLRGRSQEMALRTVLGAGRMRLLRQLAGESLLLASIGGACAIVLAGWGLSLLVSVRPEDLPRPDAIALDGAAWAVAAALTMGAGLLFTLLSGLQVRRRRLADDLKNGAQTSLSRGEGRTGRLLLVVETASATLLLICAGLTLNSFVRLTQADTGYSADGIIAARLPLLRHLVSDENGNQRMRSRPMRPFVETFMERLRADGRVEDVGVAMAPPFSSSRLSSKMVLPQAPDQEERVNMNVVTPGFFTTLRARLLEGALLSQQDSPRTAPVGVVNAAFQRRYFPGESPVGRQITLSGDPLTIVGVVANIHRGPVDQAAPPEVFTSMLQHDRRYWGISNVIVRVRGKPEDFFPDLRALAVEIEPEAELSSVVTLESALYDSVARPRFYAFLGLVLSAVATCLVAIGLWGLVAFAAARRRRSIAIRIALGARPVDVVRASVRTWMALVGFGTLIGVASGLAASRYLMTVELFRINSTDPATYALVVGVLMGVALLASWLPARRAARLDPIEALRAD